MKISRLVRFWVPPVVWAIVIFIFSATPTAPVSTVYWREFLVKKTIHVVEYAIFCALMYRAFIQSGMDKVDAATYAILVSATYAISDEYHQSFTPGREPTVRDVVFDTIGASLAIYVIWKLLPQAPMKLRNLARKLELI